MRKCERKYQFNVGCPDGVNFDWIRNCLPDTVPVWCSVDLRDGNQALIAPMSNEERLAYFDMLCKIGFKEIDVGAPGVSERDYEFIRLLIDGKRVPKNVKLQIMCGLKKEEIDRALDAVKGAENIIIHICYPISFSYHKYVTGYVSEICSDDESEKTDGFSSFYLDNSSEKTDGFYRFFSEESSGRMWKTSGKIAKNVEKAARYLKEKAVRIKEDFRDLWLEFTPEGANDAPAEYVLEICNDVICSWLPDFSGRVIINIPSTVETHMPHMFGALIEYLNKNLEQRSEIALSIHPHNDMGGAIATAEMALLAGAERVEGTLFGNGERTGNVDLVTLALNFYTHGISPGLDFLNLPEIRSLYETLTGNAVNQRQPYAGELVFTAFTGSHQEAIMQGLNGRQAAGDITQEKSEKITEDKVREKSGRITEDKAQEESEEIAVDKVSEKSCDIRWDVPYLLIDPEDVGRSYDSDVIRINASSGKGGVSYILRNYGGYIIPEKMKKDVADTIKELMGDAAGMELSVERVNEIFESRYINNVQVFAVSECHFKQENGISVDLTVKKDEDSYRLLASGNGRLDATSNAFKRFFGTDYELAFYEEHALSNGSEASAAAYVGIKYEEKIYWGVGIDSDIIKSSVSALVVAVNKLLISEKKSEIMKDMMIRIMNFIQNNYTNVTLDMLAEEFHFTKPYMSKYISINAGKTFSEIVRDIRMKKACELLKSSRISVEMVAARVGYPSAEHFNRLFRKKYGVTPMQYRKKD